TQSCFRVTSWRCAHGALADGSPTQSRPCSHAGTIRMNDASWSALRRQAATTVAGSAVQSATTRTRAFVRGELAAWCPFISIVVSNRGVTPMCEGDLNVHTSAPVDVRVRRRPAQTGHDELDRHPTAVMSVAFVLSGGASLGAVRVGMLRALVDEGIRPDLLVGTSVGAVNGAFLAGRDFTRQSVDELAELWLSVR